METQANYQSSVTPKMVKRFFEFDHQNPRIYKYFKKFAIAALGKKPNRTIGAQFIIERIRWEIVLHEDHTEEFKLPNEYAPAYARKFMDENPRYFGLINIRKSVFDDYFECTQKPNENE